MPPKINNSEKIRVTSGHRVETEIRAALIADPDSLLAILNTIEHSVATGFRRKNIFSSTRRLGVSFH